MATAGPLLRRLWRAPPSRHRFNILGEVTARWADLVETRCAEIDNTFDVAVVDLGCMLLRTLPATADRTVLLHGDFHPGNILSAQREPWLAIDPKPMVGDPAYDAVQLVIQAGRTVANPSSRTMVKRIADVAASLGLDAERVAAWTVARSVEAALWYLSVGDRASAETSITHARFAAQA